MKVDGTLSREDLDFLLYDWLNVESLTTHDRFAAHSRETFDALLDLSAEMALKCFAPHNKKADENEPTVGPDGTVRLIDDVKVALDAFSAAGLAAGPFPEEVGGLQLPSTDHRASMAWFQAANASTSSYPFLTIAAAHLLEKYGSKEQIATWMRPMIEGRYSGTMCLSEPEAGSSLADISTKALQGDDGAYRIIGTKMWISGGDHELTDNIVHLVLAKAPGGGPGVKGISLFVVPRFLEDGRRNDVALVGLNHKMGYRGITNTLLNFGDGTHSAAAEPGAVGYLVGELHHGLGYMFEMMNEARIGVGFIAASIGYAGYLRSLDYAKTRRQGRAISGSRANSDPVPLIEHADVRRMLLAQKSYVEGALGLGLYCAKLVDDLTIADPADQAELQMLLDILTPVAKSWPSQWCLEANSLAIQVLGGYGYARDYGVEQLYRDNRLNPIHEGTHGVQGLDLLGRKVSMADGAAFAALVRRMRATIARCDESRAEASSYAKLLSQSVGDLVVVTEKLVSVEDRAVALANASIYLEATGHVVVAWLWLEQVIAAGDRGGRFFDGKRAAARYFFTYELPRTGPQFGLLASLDTTTLDLEPEWL